MLYHNIGAATGRSYVTPVRQRLHTGRCQKRIEPAAMPNLPPVLTNGLASPRCQPIAWRSSDHRAGVKASNQACTAISAQTRMRRKFSHSHPPTTLYQSQQPIPVQVIRTLVTASQSEKTSRSHACTSIQYQHDNRGSLGRSMA